MKSHWLCTEGRGEMHHLGMSLKQSILEMRPAQWIQLSHSALSHDLNHHGKPTAKLKHWLKPDFFFRKSYVSWASVNFNPFLQAAKQEVGWINGLLYIALRLPSVLWSQAVPGCSKNNIEAEANLGLCAQGNAWHHGAVQRHDISFLGSLQLSVQHGCCVEVSPTDFSGIYSYARVLWNF